MAYLNVNSLEDVNFGGKECQPVITAEIRLRLSHIKSFDDDADGILASAFPKDEEYVKAFLQKMPLIEKQILHAYLIGGPSMVEVVQKEIKKIMEDSLNNE